jgi:hypothetical protein
MKSNHLYSIRAIMLAAISLGIFTQFTYSQEEENSICDEFQLSGAIFTTNQKGEPVNMNIYNNKRQVYLDGGPGPGAPVGAAALPEGDYYFQVTDPSGQTLLSSDSIGSRKFTISDVGVIVSAVHSTNDDADYGGSPYYAKVVQLYPFDDTPNNGGVYKVWVTPVDCYNPGEGKHGFIPKYSKTDNFKVRGKVDQYLCVQKFKDCDGDGIWDEDEPEIPDKPGEEGWLITVKEPGGMTQQKRTAFCIVAWDGCWQVTEEIIGDGCKGWKPTVVYIDGDPQTDPATSATVCFTGEVTKNEAEIHTVVFGNQPLSSIKVIKFYDLNNNTVNDDGIFVPGIKFLLRDGDKNGEVIDTQYTDENGCARFCGLTGGIYTVEEVLPSTCNWIATTDTVIECIEVKDCQDPLEIPLEFGNIITGTACFSTKGLWHNKNGLNELDQGDIDYVNGLAPYISASSYFEAGDEPFDGHFSDGRCVAPAYNNDKITDGIIDGAGECKPKAEVSHFLVDSNANGDPREQLAQQLLAFIFNVRHRLDDESAVILQPSLWEGPASDLIAAAIAAWSSGDANLQNYYKNKLVGLNERECNPGVEYILPLPPNSCITYPE